MSDNRRVFKTSDELGYDLEYLERVFNDSDYKDNLSEDEWCEMKCNLRDIAFMHYKVITAPIDREFKTAGHFGDYFLTQITSSKGR